MKAKTIEYKGIVTVRQAKPELMLLHGNDVPVKKHQFRFFFFGE
ncbi:hypothetical protein [Paenibacillus kribbensis]|nr:hypothetical protein [Paenibacillus kribbensis]